MIEQLTVLLENKKGRLSGLCRDLADADVNINDSEIVSDNDKLSAMHVDATTTAQGESKVKYASNVSITGSDTVVTGNITSNAQESAD